MSFKARSGFEFTLLNYNNLATKVYSPPFATSFDTFWQLKFKPTSKENPEYCSVYLVAIPSHEEGGTTSTWTNRATYSADIYIKHPETFVEIKKATLDTTKFSAIKPLRGWNRFCKKHLLPSDQIILGIEFDKTEFGTPDEKPRFPGNGKPFPDDLVTAWADQLNKPEHADVEFRVQGQSIYANTTILTRRSEYFQRMFEGRWMESITYNQSEEDQIPNAQPPPQQQVPTPEDEDTDMDSNILGSMYSSLSVRKSKRIIIEVIDFHPDTFLEMLRFLYTNRVSFGPRDSPTSAVNMFKIADKYLIENLQQHAKVKLCRGVNVNNAAEFLFTTAWQYDELRDHVMSYVVQNFQNVCKTSGFKNITLNSGSYPQFHDLLTEILHKVFPDGDSDYSDY
ncbi:6509_t:CDS:2 [Cetraspora pellucida]|uniref:6509_t:CDS:1 n=1 Tax=Cetraspora pellucida TaxID=1433469 RepID=A0ACA9MG97_9GLOM|nr:6509_t:CDS:2 [Cetraspora pellucida]